jgi:hypothetical protein
MHLQRSYRLTNTRVYSRQRVKPVRGGLNDWNVWNGLNDWNRS